MNLVCILIILVHPYTVISLRNIHVYSEGWWGNIHHLSQLTLLAKLEELQLVPDFTKMKQKLQLEKRKIKYNLDLLINLKFDIQLKKLGSYRLRFTTSTQFGTRLKETINYNRNSRSTSVHVTLNDVFMSVNSFLHIHEIYGIKLTSGYDYHITQGSYLNILCNLIIGIIALSREMHYRAVEWMEPIPKTKSNQNDHNLMQLQSSLYSVTIQQHNRVINKLRSDAYSSSELYQLYTNLFSEPIKLRFRQAAKISDSHVAYPPKFSDTFNRSSLHSKFTNLCKRHTLQTPKTQKLLKCYHNQHSHPYFYIKPLKVEQLSKNPPILQIYDVLGHKTINYVKAFKEVLINPKTLYGEHARYLGFENVATYARRNMQNYVYQNYPQFGIMSEFLTGLKIKDLAGPLLWAEYTYGRMVGVHEDTAGDPGNFDGLVTLLKKGEMLAALMFYIDTPDEGGQTPYLQAGIRAEAVKGSAVFWMTSYRNGSRRRDVHHAGCPILHGNKIVMITPIWYNANWNHHKCSLNSYE